MSEYKVVEVTTRGDLNRFIQFPDDLYKDCPQYVPALHIDQRRSLTKVSTLKYCKRKMWLVLDGKKVVGRICGMINPRYNERFNTRRARFGWFDMIEDFEVAKLLISTAEQWAKSEGMTEIHGPLYYNTLGKQGMLIEGFENIPPFNCIYNFPYYKDFVEKLGFQKECDWIQYKMASTEKPAEKMYRIANMLKTRYNLHTGDIDKLKKDPAMVDKFFKTYNESFADTVYNFIPFTEEEIKEEAASMLGFVSSKTCTIVLDENNDLAGFGITLPSISKGLQKAKGHLFPFGWYHILKAMHTYETVDLMLNGATPKWQNTGVSAIFHCDMFDKLAKVGSKWAIANPQIETNGAVNVWDKYSNTELYMRRRCYIKPIE